ncbi:MAG: cell division protein ZapA [Butyricicoccus pullicaecorum]
MQNRLTVTIAGQKFSLVADEPEAYMKEIAALADQKIAEAKKLVGNTTFSTGVLATLNMADEAVKLRHQCEEYKNQAQEQQEALAKSKGELGLMQDELDTDTPCVRMKTRPCFWPRSSGWKRSWTPHNLHDSVCAESDAEMADSTARSTS